MQTKISMKEKKKSLISMRGNKLRNSEIRIEIYECVCTPNKLIMYVNFLL